MTQEGWAARLGYGRRTIQRWEHADLAPDAGATEAFVRVCADLGLFRTYQHGVLAGAKLSDDVLRALLADARTDGTGSKDAVSPAAEPAVPVALTSFVGREQQLAEISQLLKTTRLLTLTGPGGIGKTRLALQALQTDSNSESRRALFIDLSPLVEGSLVPQTVAASLGVREQPGQSLVETLVAHMRNRSILLVLDNCEHVLDSCARLVAALLSGCPQVNILATSRETLRVPGEMVWQVPPLSLPEKPAPIDTDFLMQSEAVRLFVERAEAARPTFALRIGNAAAVAEICRRLDGIPLAIELAAARVKVLSTEQIAEHLVDRLALLTRGDCSVPARHSTLRAAIDWSYALLDPSERVIAQRLSVFAGGCTLEAADAICRDLAVGGRVEMLDRLTRLVEASLVMVEEQQHAARYRQLETLRAYGTQQLEASGAAEGVREWHATHYLDWAEALAARADGPENSAWMSDVDTEYDNLRAALTWLAAHETARALRLAVAIERYWYQRGFVAEGCRWLEDLLSRASDRGELWGSGALKLADLLTLRRDEVQARRYGEMSLEVLRAAGDIAGTARAACFLGLRALQADDFGQARTLCYTSIALARHAGEQRVLVKALDNLGLLEIAEHNLSDAKRCFEEGLALARAIGYGFGDVSAVARLGAIARLEGDYGRARVLIEQGLETTQAFGHRPAAATYLTSLGNLARCEGKHAEARRLLLESLEVGEREVGLPLVLLNTVGALGVLAVAEKAYEDGVRLLSAISAAGAPHGTVQIPELRHDIQAALASAREALSEPAYATSWAEGQAWSIADAIEQTRSATEPPTTPATRSNNSLSPSTAVELTPRQRDVAELVALGYTNREIGQELVITEGTARVHIEHILARLNLRSRAQLAVWAVAHGLVTANT